MISYRIEVKRGIKTERYLLCENGVLLVDQDATEWTKVNKENPGRIPLVRPNAQQFNDLVTVNEKIRGLIGLRKSTVQPIA